MPGTQALVARLRSGEFLLHAAHPDHPGAFTRQRKLPLPALVALLLSGMRKSIQSELDEFFAHLSNQAQLALVSPSKLSPRRMVLRLVATHSMFIERGCPNPANRGTRAAQILRNIVDHARLGLTWVGWITEANRLIRQLIEACDYSVERSFFFLCCSLSLNISMTRASGLSSNVASSSKWS